MAGREIHHFINTTLRSFILKTGVVLFFLFFFTGGFSQQVLLSEGGQKIKIFDDGSYSILPVENEKPIFLSTLQILDGEEKLQVQIKIIEAEYFVLLYNLHKAVDILDLSIQQAHSEGNLQLAQDYRNKSKELKGKIKDSESLYDNALSYYKSAKKLASSPDDKKLKRRDKIEKYIESKDYIFKTSKYRDDASQEWLAYDAKTFESKISAPLEPEEKLPTLITKENFINPDCRITEESQGDKHVFLQPFTPLFYYTPDRLKSFLKQDNLIHGLTRLRKNNQDFYLDFQMVIHSKDAAKSYGHVSEGSLIRFEFVNGIRLNLKAEETSLGRIEEYSGKVYYVFSFLLDKEMMKQLEILPIDYVGIMWTTGYEKYEVFEIDGLMRQFQCFKNLKN